MTHWLDDPDEYGVPCYTIRDRTWWKLAGAAALVCALCWAFAGCAHDRGHGAFGPAGPSAPFPGDDGRPR